MRNHPLRDALESQDYNLRERANIYSGAVLGALAPIVAFRYMISTPSEMSVGQEALAWGLSIGANAGVSIFAEGFPLVYSTLMGTTLGIFGAHSLRRKRHDKIREEIKLESIIQDINESKLKFGEAK